MYNYNVDKIFENQLGKLNKILWENNESIPLDVKNRIRDNLKESMEICYEQGLGDN